jgi:hypothetical protein
LVIPPNQFGQLVRQGFGLGIGIALAFAVLSLLFWVAALVLVGATAFG